MDNGDKAIQPCAARKENSNAQPKPSMSRADVMKLIRQKDEIEAEVKALYEVLDSQGKVGMDGPLLDNDGYPRSDIDVYTVRHARHKIICLNNDHKALMRCIEDGLTSVHEQAREEYMEHDAQNVTDAQKPRQPFAKVQFVATDSPAFAAGLQGDDRLVTFGSLTSANFRTLTDLAVVVTNSENRSLSVEVLRDGNLKRVTLVPKKWSGKGLVGCSFVEEKKLLL
ncbi:hypothetical protein RvY_07434-2 [Ramazzottius varieornatus]|uniref:Nas2 N-terminal domain-containing protein n=1 Tax=Ramazzottius varieornatus TaxID=947166 RepID=A0A1D1VAL3_RAMVA|nr:hypothetical protein RvY_07434-2 [Ramazzottius varieornatus]